MDILVVTNIFVQMLRYVSIISPLFWLLDTLKSNETIYTTLINLKPLNILAIEQNNISSS